MRGPFFEELAPGDTFTSSRRTITEADVVLFTSMAGLISPLFRDLEHAQAQGYERCLVPGPLTFAYSIGLTEDLTHYTVLAALAFDELRFHSPVHAGDTIWVRTEVLECRQSEGRPDTGVVRMRHTVEKTGDVVVADYIRTMLYGTSKHFEGGPT